jgi:serine protease
MSHPVRRRCATLALVLSISALIVNSPALSAAGLPPIVNGKHVMWAAGQGYPSTDQTSANNLIYHGGTVQTVPAVFIVYWGTEWSSGFTATHGSSTYTSATVQNYINSFFTSVGGSLWAGALTQYCQGITAPAFSCTGQSGAQPITNPSQQLKGTWTDPTPVPSDIVTTALVSNFTTDPLEAEAARAAQHFGYDANATYMIFTPPNHGATGYGSIYCAYHHETTHTTSPGVRYAFIPYVPEQGSACGGNKVNAPDDAFGHGYLDGYSIVAGHEYAETVTDPGDLNGYQDGWNDATTSETGDKCAWSSLQNITLAGQFYAVQQLWSNAANGGHGGCVIATSGD